MSINRNFFTYSKSYIFIQFLFIENLLGLKDLKYIICTSCNKMKCYLLNEYIK